MFQNKSVLRTKHKKTNKGYFTPPQLPKSTSAKQTPAVDHNGLNCPSRSKIQDFEKKKKKNMKNHCGFIQKFRSQDHHLQPGEFPHANCHSFDRIRIPPLHQTPRLLIPEKPRSYGPQMRLWMPQKTVGKKSEVAVSHGKGGERWIVACSWRLVDEDNSCWQWTCPNPKDAWTVSQNQWSTVLIKPTVFLRYFTSDSDVFACLQNSWVWKTLYLATRRFNSSFLHANSESWINYERRP